MGLILTMRIERYACTAVALLEQPKVGLVDVAIAIQVGSRTDRATTGINGCGKP